MTVSIYTGDCRERLRELPAASVQCVVTSPPYYGLRDYGHDGQIGLEQSPADYVAELVAVFREVRRVLRDDGTVWLNLGDSYASGKNLLGIPWRVAFALQDDGWYLRQDIIWHKPNTMPESVRDRCTKAHEYVFLLTKRARYFYDADAIAAEAKKYSAFKTPGLKSATFDKAGPNGRNGSGKYDGRYSGRENTLIPTGKNGTRNRRSVWRIATQPFSGAHFAVMPPALVERCIKAGTSEHGACGACGAPWVRVVEKEFVSGGPKWAPNAGNRAALGDVSGKSVFVTGGANQRHTLGWEPSCDCSASVVPCVVLDPFGGAGTVGLVADRLKRDAVLIELNPEYAEMARQRIVGDAPIFARVEVVL